MAGDGNQRRLAKLTAIVAGVGAFLAAVVIVKDNIGKLFGPKGSPTVTAIFNASKPDEPIAQPNVPTTIEQPYEDAIERPLHDSIVARQENSELANDKRLVRKDENGLRNILADPSCYRFKLGSIEIVDEVLDAEHFAYAADLIRNFGSITLVGQGDPLGVRDQNLSLSQRRAQAVAEWLVIRGLPTDKIVHLGVGKQEPAVDNIVKIRACSVRVLGGSLEPIRQ